MDLAIKLILLIIFFSVMIGIGLYCRRHATDVSGFVLVQWPTATSNPKPPVAAHGRSWMRARPLDQNPVGNSCSRGGEVLPRTAGGGANQQLSFHLCGACASQGGACAARAVVWRNAE